MTKSTHRELWHTLRATLLCVALSAACVGCKPIDDPTPEPPAPTPDNALTLCLHDNGVAEGSVAFPWKGGEKALVVTNGADRSVVEVSVDEKDGTATAPISLNDTQASSYTFEVYVPHSPEEGVTAVDSATGVLQIALPTTQIPTATGPDAHAVVRYGLSESHTTLPESASVTLSHWTAYGTLSLSGLNLEPQEVVKSIAVVASEPLWGTFSHNRLEGTTKVTSGASKLMLSAVEGVDNVWFATAPCERVEWLDVSVVTTRGGYHTRISSFDNGDELSFASGKVSALRVDMSEAVVAPSISPLSGTPLKASAALGLAPLTFRQTSSLVVYGSAHISSSRHADLFVQCVSSLDYDTEGVYYCPYESTTADGRLVYGTPRPIGTYPWAKGFTAVRVFEHGGDVWAVAITATRANYCKYDAATNSFGTSWLGSVELSTGYTVASSDIVPNGDGTAEIVLLCNTIEGKEPVTEDKLDAWYDSAGKYLGTIPYGTVYTATINLSTWKLESGPKRVGPIDVMAFPAGISRLRNAAKGVDGYVLSTYFGNLKFMPASAPDKIDYIYGPDGEPVTNKVTVNKMRSVALDADNATDDLVVSGEAVMYHYSFAGQTNANGIPTLHHGRQVMAREGELYGGNLSVPNVVDWDGDGVLDIVSGNGGGYLLFFKNYCTNESPAFGEGEYICRRGKPICIRAGYYELQGPQESGWGYLCPTVVDWNSDGLLDVVYSYNEGIFEVMLGEGTPTSPRLGARQSLKLDGMELYGAWRVRPAVFSAGGHTYIVTMDDTEALHLYRYASSTAVLDMGLLLLSDGNQITGYRANGTAPTLSERGRHKLEIADWDGDGVLDLLVGTTKQASFPSPTYGLPWTHWERTREALDVLVFRNVGTNEAMQFAYPKMFQFRGEDMNIGTHSNAPTVCRLGIPQGSKPNLLVGTQSGRFFYFDRNDLTEFTLWP